MLLSEIKLDHLPPTMQYVFFMCVLKHCLTCFCVQKYEKGLSQSLYTYIRAGKLEEAVELCRAAQQPWRAASIRGSLLFKFKAIGTNFFLVEKWCNLMLFGDS